MLPRRLTSEVSDALEAALTHLHWIHHKPVVLRWPAGVRIRLHWLVCAQHGRAVNGVKVPWFSRGGKCSGCAVEDCVLTWGDLDRTRPRERQRRAQQCAG